MSLFQLEVIVDLPAYSALNMPLSYLSSDALDQGALVQVPLGKKEVLGIVWQCRPYLDAHSSNDTNLGNTALQLKTISSTFHIPPLTSNWLALAQFTTQYYQRALGEVALQALPPELRKITPVQLDRKLKKLQKEIEHQQKESPNASSVINTPLLTPEQERVISQITPEEPKDQSQRIFLLQGTTGSGKTEVYMRAAQKILQTDKTAQVLILVPEINLTPQLEARFKERFPHIPIACQHSGMTTAQRTQDWLKAHAGYARIILGTRMAVFTSIPHLKMIVVDEEHDPSYKQYEGARWSARDLAVWRGWHEKVPVILGSATPSLESWLHAQRGQYQFLEMPSRVGGGEMPRVRMVDMRQQPRNTLLAKSLLEAIQERLNRKEQVLVLLNRRGYAPVLHCSSCGWQSQCSHCTAWRVFHRKDRTLRCHHCGFTQPVPRACPECGDLDLHPIGQGTEKLEELLQSAFTKSDGSPAEVVRIDADSTRQTGSLEKHLDRIHSGEADILVGTQMVAKGHDFRRVTLVAAVNPDSALFSTDFRASERLFSLLLQAAGRAGRDAALAAHSEVWIQTALPTHPLFQAVKNYDFTAFAKATLEEREMAAMPPFVYQALLRAEAKTQETAQLFLQHAYQKADGLLQQLNLVDLITIYPAIPAAMQRVANIERAQMLLESTSRQALQKFLAAWSAELHGIREKGMIRWVVDIDPQSI